MDFSQRSKVNKNYYYAKLDAFHPSNYTFKDIIFPEEFRLVSSNLDLFKILSSKIKLKFIMKIEFCTLTCYNF